jgi:hypothetical protein
MALSPEEVGRRQIDNLIGTVLFLFFLACLLPCIDCGPDIQSGDPGFPDIEKGWHLGFSLLLSGWRGGNNGIPWSANVLLLIGVWCLGTRRLWRGLLAGLVAAALGLTSWWARRYDTLMVGYYLWQASLFMLAAASAWALHRSRSLKAKGATASG